MSTDDAMENLRKKSMLPLVGSYERALATLRRENEALRKAVEWRDIATAPKDELVLVYCTRFREVCEAFCYYDSGWHTFTVNGARKSQPTHWLPLPPPPAAALGEKP